VTKFSPLVEYKATQGQYQLLPFKFEPLDDHDVVITNYVGEFAFISREDLEATISKKLDPNSKIYSLLRSLHFIKEKGDEASIELLGLKTRTKYSKLRNFTNLHIFVVTLRCDHSCQYCQVSRQSENKVAFDMTITWLKKPSQSSSDRRTLPSKSNSRAVSHYLTSISSSTSYSGRKRSTKLKTVIFNL